MKHRMRLVLLAGCTGLAVTLAGCEDGSDFGPGTPETTVVVEGGSGNSGGGDSGGNGDDGTTTVGGVPIGPGLVDNPDDPIPDGALIGIVASDDGDSATGEPAAPDPANADPYALSAFWDAVAADPPLNNSTSVRGLIDSTGMPIGTPPELNASFTVPGEWPLDSASDANSFPVPDYITDTDYIGAFEPGVGRDAQWTAGWTIALNGNKTVWRFFGGEPGTALESNTDAPVADGSCPQGTTLAGSFTEVIGDLANDAEARFSGNAALGDYDVCTLAGRYESDGETISLTNDNVYNIADNFPGTKVGSGDLDSSNDPAAAVNVTLEIEAGTLIYGEEQEALIVTRGSQAFVDGTANAPVVMTSKRQLERRFDGDPETVDGSQVGEWAGLGIMGFARDNQCGSNFVGCNVLAEGGIGNYGGDVDDESSGRVTYLVIRHAGNDLDGQGNELNGFSLFAVGRNTELQNVQIHRGFDDGIEFFGGNAFIKNLVLTGNGDDSLDFDNGWTGGAQNVIIIQEGSPRSNHGIEADSRFAQEPITFELLSNLTIIGPRARATNNDRANDEGIRFREGKRTQVHNAIITGDYVGCLNVNDPDTFFRADEAEGSAPDAPGPHFRFRNSIIDCVNGANFSQE